MKVRVEEGNTQLLEIVGDDVVKHFHPDTTFIDIPDNVYSVNDFIFPALRHIDGELGMDRGRMNEAAKALVADRRWQRETGGIIVSGVNFTIPTTTEAQNKIASIVRNYQDGVLAADETSEFIVGPYTATMTKDKISFVNQAVGRYVQNVFNRQKEIYDVIDQLLNDETITLVEFVEYLLVELNKWPANEYTLTA